MSQKIRSAKISTVLRSAEGLREAVRVTGASAPGQALLLSRWCIERGNSVLVLCPSQEIAETLASDVEALSTPQLKAHLFPTWEQSPYSPVAPSIRARLDRIAILSLLRSESRPKLIFTTIQAAVQATLAPRALARHALALKAGESARSREELARALVDAGYLRVDPVEDPGTFAVRGDIIDVFPPERALPLRIELFGDEIERIREFDPSSQRARSEGAPLEACSLGPAREVLINSETASALRERLKARADDLGIPRSVRDPIMASLQEGVYPEHADAWAPFAYGQEIATLWDHLSDSWEVAWSDELGCEQEWDRFVEEQKRVESDAPAAGIIMPARDELFRWSAGLQSALRDRTRLYLDRLEIAPGEAEEELTAEAPPPPDELISSRIRVAMKSNADLVAARRTLSDLEARFRLWRDQGFRVVIFASTQSQLERIRFLLQEHDFYPRTSGPSEPGTILLSVGQLSEGFRWPAEGLVVLTGDEVLGTRHRRQRRTSSRESGSASRDWSGLQALSDLQVGDAIVHMDHGIGRYQGLVRLDLSGAPSDFLLLEYANKDKLYLPVYRLNVIQKYVGAGESAPLDKLGSQQFAKAKERVRGEVRKIAFDLVQLYAERQIRPGMRFGPRDALFSEFEAKFPFDETPDQLRAIDDTLDDLESGKAMDRLVCGDVGYGKTEVAIRAAFRAVSEGKQVAVLVPTTVLAAQHEQSFRARMKDYPITLASISRFKSSKEQKQVLADLASGRIDVVIGTHRLLSKDVKFRELGLVIVDEEHRFGVEHKEKLKTLKVNTHVLTLTATPIPRTLHMALSGLRDISLMNTPPVDRLPIRTYVSKFDEALIQRALEFELGRGGQVFFVHNRVQSIFEIANRVRELVPRAQLAVAHGQMAEKELEEAMMAFYEKRANVLVCTSIIESGLDVPSANTILVNRADRFGLAQLYQIRGRVGRGQARAYAYLLLPPEGMISEDAKKRLEVIQRFVELGSGFSIASHDLEIRGGGDLLGPQQSGQIAAVGFDLYTELLEEAIRELRGRPETVEEQHREPEIKAPFAAFLSEEYVPDVHQRLSLYRRFSAAATESELDRLEEELRDRYGALPEPAQNLIWLIRIKQLLKQYGVDSLTVGKGKVSLLPGQGSRLDPDRAIALISAYPDKYQLTPDSKLVASLESTSLRDLLFGLERLFAEFSPRA